MALEFWLDACRLAIHLVFVFVIYCMVKSALTPVYDMLRDVSTSCCKSHMKLESGLRLLEKEIDKLKEK